MLFTIKLKLKLMKSLDKAKGWVKFIVIIIRYMYQYMINRRFYQALEWLL